MVLPQLGKLFIPSGMCWFESSSLRWEMTLKHHPKGEGTGNTNPIRAPYLRGRVYGVGMQVAQSG